MNTQELKQLVTPREVAIRYLGRPVKTTSGYYWYNSPFRNETHPSFAVDDRGFIDFGLGWNGDIIDFCMKYFSIDFKGAIQFIGNDFGIATTNEYETAEIRKIKYEQRQAEKKHRETVKKWYNTTFGKLCDKYKEWEEIRRIYDGKIWLEAYAIALNKLCFYEYLIEYFNENDKDKESLYRERGQIECHLT